MILHRTQGAVFSRALFFGSILWALVWSGCISDDDNNHECQLNTDCGSEKPYCLNARCTECLQDGDCGDGLACVDGVCGEDVVLCRTDADCVFGQECVSGECATAEGFCQRTSDCPEGMVCRGDLARCVFLDGETDECTRNSDCRAGEICQGGDCVAGPETDECARDSDCRDGEMCSNGDCVPDQSPECTRDSDCRSDEFCEDGECVAEADECTRDSDCRAGEICSNGDCIPECAEDRDCGNNEVCNGGTCVPDANVTCTEDPSVCAGNEECCEGACVPFGECGGSYWDICTAASQCPSDLCITDFEYVVSNPSQPPRGRCTERCAYRSDCPQVPGSSFCLQNYHQATQGNGGSALVGLCNADDTGKACSDPSSCVDGLCLARVQNGQAVQQCSIRCASAADCKALHACAPVSFGSDQVINTCSPVGTPCSGPQAADQCFTGVCLSDDQGSGYCSSWCITNGDCPNGWSCTEVEPGARVCTQ